MKQAPICDFADGFRRNADDVVIDSQVHADSAKGAKASDDSTSIWALVNLLQKELIQWIRTRRVRHGPIRDQALGDVPHIVSQLRQTRIVREIKNDGEHIAG